MANGLKAVATIYTMHNQTVFWLSYCALSAGCIGALTLAYSIKETHCTSLSLPPMSSETISQLQVCLLIKAPLCVLLYSQPGSTDANIALGLLEQVHGPLWPKGRRYSGYLFLPMRISHPDSQPHLLLVPTCQRVLTSTTGHPTPR